MSVVYNDCDAAVCAWLNALIERRHLPRGVVVCCDVRSLSPSDVSGYQQVHLFAGIGGWPLALQMARWPDEITVWTASLPCQPLSVAGQRRGPDDERHLWPAVYRLIAECRPPIILGEQVASALGKQWLSAVRADLEALGYACGAADLCAASVGAPHIRQRLYWVAYANGARLEGLAAVGELLGSQCEAAERDNQAGAWTDPSWVDCRDGVRRPIGPGTFPLAHGVPARVVRLRGYGNAIVPQLGAAFAEAALQAIGDLACFA